MVTHDVEKERSGSTAQHGRRTPPGKQDTSRRQDTSRQKDIARQQDTHRQQDTPAAGHLPAAAPASTRPEGRPAEHATTNNQWSQNTVDKVRIIIR